MKKILILLFLSILLIACADTEADVVNSNLSQSADSFEIERRIIFVNSETGEYLFTIEGLCSLDVNNDSTLKVTCKTGENEYKRHYLGLSSSVSYFVEQLEGQKENPYRYKVEFRPSTIIPDIEVDLGI